MIRIGIVGLGFMGRMHLAAYRKLPLAHVVAVADRNPDRLRSDLSAGWGNIAGAADHLDLANLTTTTDLHLLLHQPDIDVIDICAPTPQHDELAAAALSAGKHVICEKPLALTSAAALHLAHTAAASSRLLMPAMCIRFWPQYHLLYQAVHDQRFGPLLDASFHRLGSAPPGWFRDGSQSGGAILDLHLHDTDFVHYLLGPPQAVFSQGYTGPSGLIDAISSSFIYQPSASAVPAPPHFIHLQATWTQHPAAPFTMSYRANFQHATLIFDSTRQPSLTIASAAGLESPDFSSDGYEQELAYFIDCIATGSRPDRADPLHVARSQCIIEAEARSVTSGRIEPVHFG